MDDKQNVGGRDRLVRVLLTVVLSVVAVRSLRSGKRLRGLLAGTGALGLGFTATTGYCGVNEALDIDTTGESEEVSIEFDESDEATSEPADEAGADQQYQLTCAACGDPIVPGQSRGPNEDDEIVHDDCA